MAEAIFYIVFLIVVGGVNALKGKYWMILLSLGFIGIITAIRVAKPGSYWDRRWSSVGDHEKALARFTKHRDAVAAAEPPPLAPEA